MKIIGKDSDFVYEASRPGDIMHSLADISKAKENSTLNQNPTLQKDSQRQ